MVENRYKVKTWGKHFFYRFIIYTIPFIFGGGGTTDTGYGLDANKRTDTKRQTVSQTKNSFINSIFLEKNKNLFPAQ